MKKLLLALAGICSAVVVWAGASSGNCMKAAVDLGGIPSSETTKNVTLVNEWDPEGGDDGKGGYTDWGAYYLKVKISKYDECSFWIENIDDEVDFFIDVDWDDEKAPSASFDWADCPSDMIAYTMERESWDEEDPSSGTYYIMFSGDIGKSYTLHYQKGVVDFSVPGTYDHPVSITPEVKLATKKGSLIDGEYWFSMKVTAGVAYRLYTTGGTADAPLSLAIDATSKELTVDPTYTTETDQGFLLIPSETRSVDICVSGDTKFEFNYQKLEGRPISEHEIKATLETDKPVKFVPGRKVADRTYPDEIIDECLFRIPLKKGERRLFVTEGAKSPVNMVVYDASGNVLSTLTASPLHPEASLGVEASSDGNYYVGVCNPSLGPDDKPTGSEISIVAKDAPTVAGVPDLFDPKDDKAAGATALQPVPGTETNDVVKTDIEGNGPHRLNWHDWADTFRVGARKGLSYAFKVATDEAVTNMSLKAEVFTLNGSAEVPVDCSGDINPDTDGALTFTAKADAVYYVRLSVAEGRAYDYPEYRLCSMAYANGGDSLGYLKVVIKGNPDATWTLDKEKTLYKSGDSFLCWGTHTVKFSKAPTGFTKPADKSVTIKPYADGVTEVVVSYNDKYDPKDDETSGKGYGASALTISAKEKSYPRTLFSPDPQDYFSFTAKAGVYYSFRLDGCEGGDAVMTVVDSNKKAVAGPAAESIAALALPAGKYFVKVSHANAAEPSDTPYYELAASSANVGAIKFSKKEMKVKDTATSVKLTVSRSAKEGLVRVRYYTVDGMAKANEQYIAQSGILEWPDKDSKSKTVEIKLIPKLLAIKTGDTDFKVVLEDAGGDYPASITTPECKVTIQNSGKCADAKEAYAKANKTKKATVRDETVSLRGGTYYGVVQTLSTSNGLPALASVTLTVGAKDAGDPTKDTISAKVMLAGKTYTFKTAKGEQAWDEGVPGAGGVFKKKLLLTQKIGTVTVSNELSVTVHDGVPGDWTATMKEDVSLTMNVPDAKGKGYQANVKYAGGICRQNAKIQKYLDEAYKFAGYYTVSLVPGDAVLTSGKAFAKDSGLPSGNGYLTVTVDNKGGAKIAGLLADNTKVSVSATACAIVRDGKSAVLGHSMLVPVYLAKSPYCFGGWLKLTARADSGRPDGQSYKVVVDGLESELLWNNDNAALTYDGKEGWRMALAPVGGWYDKVFNLQAYYNDFAQEFGIDTIRAEGFPKEILAAGYRFETAAQSDGEGVDLAGDKFATAKKTLVKRTDNKKLNDFAASVNPCNVQVKLTRATGIVTGSCSVWSENGSAQKEITGFKHNGVITLDRDNGSDDVLADDVISAGFLSKSIKIGKRNWAFSVPFNVLAIEPEE